MFTDSTLQRLEKDRNTLITNQSEMRRDANALRGQLRAKLEDVQRDYEYRINKIERDLDEIERKLPDLTRQIEHRQKELQQKYEMEQKRVT